MVRAGNGYQPDLHEFQITPQGTAPDHRVRRDRLRPLVRRRPARRRGRGHAGPGDRPEDGARDVRVAQPRPRAAAELLHLGQRRRAAPNRSTTSTSTRSTSSQDGDLLVDSRNTWAAYDVDPKTGQVRWELGGKHSSFKLGPARATAWQHDARQQPDGAITFFDNGAFPQVHPQSRAIELALDTQRR